MWSCKNQIRFHQKDQSIAMNYGGMGLAIPVNKNNRKSKTLFGGRTRGNVVLVVKLNPFHQKDLCMR